MWEFFNFYVISGLVLGCIYALGAIGLTLTFSILRFANFAHGEMMMLGAYLTLALMQTFHISMVPALLGAMVLTAVICVFIDWGFYRPLRMSPTIILVMSSFGMMLMIRSAVQFFWGVKVRGLVSGVEPPLRWFSGAILMQSKHLAIMGGTLFLMLAMHLLLNRTKMGKAMRAVSDNPSLAVICGIDKEKVIAVTWVVVAIAAVSAGFFLALDTQITTMMGFHVLLPVFAATILGGIGKPFGAALGGLIIGLVEELSAYPILAGAPLISPGYKAGVAFTLMVLLLIWRPDGLFRGRVLR